MSIETDPLYHVKQERDAAAAALRPLDGIAERLTLQLEALHTDASRTPEFRRSEEQRLRAEEQDKAAKILAEKRTFARLEEIAAREALWSRSAIMRRAPLVPTDPTRDALERNNLREEARMMDLGELKEVIAERGGSLAALGILRRVVAEKIDKDPTRRAEYGALLGSIDSTPVPLADEAAAVFSELRIIRRKLEHAFTSLSRPITPVEKMQLARVA